LTIAVARRAVLQGPGELVVDADIETSPLGPTDLAVLPDAVGICGTDLELMSGEMTYLANGFASYPIVPGHEWTGIVAEIGSEVGGFAVGDRVVGECSVGCGSCAWCTSGSYHLCPRRTETGIAGRGGALATKFIFPSRAAHRVPLTVSAADAAFAEPIAVAYRALNRLQLRRDDALTVVGAGTIGLLTALLARALGTHDVQIVEIDPVRREFAASLAFLVYSAPRRRTPRVVEASGTTSGIAVALDACLDGGSVVLLGLTGGETMPVDVDGLVVRDLTVRGSLGSPGVWSEVVDLLADGAIKPSRLVSHEFGLEDVAAAFALARRREPGVRKIIVRPNRGGHAG